MVEPTACAIHGALAGAPLLDGVVVVLGAGSLGLLATAAVKHLAAPTELLTVAKHPEQRRLAAELGAGTVVAPTELTRAVRRATGTMAIAQRDGDDGLGRLQRLCGGADVVLDCVGSSDSLAQALAVVRPGGRIVMVGMPGTITADLTGLWHREIQLVGAYAYGTEHLADGTDRRTFDLAFELVEAADLGRLVSATYPLARFTEAVEHAAAAGSRGAVKVAFDLRQEKERNR
jgi:threonine dehydrogenase-like Zn-dependent dehydrogenase